ncbi:hypothetical protein EDC01DRAFT_674352 [Geopyxis carbonaria]|nr:hypothetical protein EDC01DRAFT_674352 [Geopyxis carbonaria]
MRQPLSKQHNEVTTAFWSNFVRDLKRGFDSQKATRRYIGKTLLFTFLDRQITLFFNWEGAQQMVLDATSKLLQKRNPEKWDHIQRIRDKFRECWHHTAAQLNSQPDINGEFSKVFSDPRATWNQAMKATSEIQIGKFPTSAQCAALLVLGWAMDLVQNENHGDLEASPNFKSDLVKWLSLFEGSSGDGQKEMETFLNKMWPDSGSTQIPVEVCKDISESRMMEDIKRDFLETNPVGKDFVIAELLIQHLMEDIGQDFDEWDMISLDASTVGFGLVEDHNTINTPTIEPVEAAVSRKRPPSEQVPKFPAEIMITYLKTGEILPSVISFFSDAIEFGIPIPIFMGILAKNVLSVCVETTAHQLNHVLSVTPSPHDISAHPLNSFRNQLPRHVPGRRQEFVDTIDDSPQHTSPHFRALTSPISIYTPISSVATPGTVLSAASSPWITETRLWWCQKCHDCHFNTKSNLSRHNRTVHGKLYKCPRCKKMLKPRADYRKKHQRACLGRPLVIMEI